MTLAIDCPQLEQVINQTDLIINATNLGMKVHDPLPIPSKYLASNHMVYDAIYKPAETKLLRQAQSIGATTSNGFSMLLHQGVLAYEHWFPGQSPVTQMKRGLSSTL